MHNISKNSWTPEIYIVNYLSIPVEIKKGYNFFLNYRFIGKINNDYMSCNIS